MNSTSPRRIARAAAVALALTGLLSACGGSGSGSKDSSSAGPVTLPFWGWANGQEAVVKAFNASHKDIQIKYDTVASGGKGGYAKMQAAVKAGNGPCLGQVAIRSDDARDGGLFA